ncbi:pyridoxal phosphate-dependent transferase [Scleroderma yunnanense]
MSAFLAIGNDTLGLPLPDIPHTVLVSLPTWNGVIGEAINQAAMHNTNMTGYPRFSIHRSVQKLTDICQEKFGFDGERCLPFPTQRTAEDGKEFIHAQALRLGMSSEVRIVHFCPNPPRNTSSKSLGTDQSIKPELCPSPFAEVHIVFFNAGTYKFARQFWQNCGLGISSRYAEHCLSLLGIPEFLCIQRPESLRCCGNPLSTRFNGTFLNSQNESELAFSTGSDAKAALRQRIADFFVRNEPSLLNVSEEDVFLFPCGMSAIWNVHQLLMDMRPLEKSVIFGFCYDDTLQVVERSGPGVIFYGHGRESDIDDLDHMLAEKQTECPSSPPILALYTECPSNPLLRTVNFPRLRELADKYNFPIVIDETVGTFANVDVLPFADIVITSLTKHVSGYPDVLGGSLVINPRMRYYSQLKSHLMSRYEDTYFDSDAIVMELNSRNFIKRMQIKNSNAEYICDFLRSRSVECGAPGESIGSHVIKDVYYPKYVSRDNYEVCRRRLPTGELDKENGGYGGVFSLTFTSMKASEAFFDALAVAKSTSFGMSFTMSLPYTMLVYYSDLEWASQYGADATLVRVSVGTEDKEDLLKIIETALTAAELA